MTPFSLNFDAIARARVIEIGNKGENHRALLIDDFFSNPDSIREAALDPELSWITPSSGYPGLRASPAVEQLDELFNFLGKLLNRTIRPETDQFAFSMVTRTEEELVPAQRHPHFDGPCTAGIVFLNPPEQCRGGTGFYRHRGTGLARYPERLTDAHSNLLPKLGLTSLEELQNVVSVAPANASGYITDSNPEWEQIKFIEMKWNRLLMYDGQIFHSAVVRGNDFGETPEKRRLTFNFFVDRV